MNAAQKKAVIVELRRLAAEDSAELRRMDDIADAHGYRTSQLVEAEIHTEKSRDRLLARAAELEGPQS